jgi:hypothetical protein
VPSLPPPAELADPALAGDDDARTALEAERDEAAAKTP